MRPALLALLLTLLPTLLLGANPPAVSAPLFDDNSTPLTIAQFVEKYIPADMPEGLGRKEVQAALEDAGANWSELADGLLMTLDPRLPELYEGKSSLIWLIATAPHLDRLELGFEHIYESVNFGLILSSEFDYDTSSELFRRFIYNYRFDDEPISQWRAEFFGRFMKDHQLGDLSEQEIRRITSDATASFTIIERGYFGNLSDPVSLLHSRAGTKRELSILVAAALRSQGYATRFVRENRSGESWVEVYNGDPKAYDAQAWTPVYPTAPDRTGDVAYATELCGGRICVVTAGDAFGREQVTSRYTQVGSLYTVFTNNGSKVEDFSGWALTAWNGATGTFVPLDDLEYPSSGAFPVEGDEPTYMLGLGDYRFEVGVRYPGGISHVQTQNFTIQSGSIIAAHTELAPPADLPQTALVERELGDFPESNRLMKRGRYVFLVGDGGEPSLRAYELLRPLESRSSVFFQHWRMVGASDEELAFVKDVLKVDLEKDALPVAIVVVDGRTTMYLRGYNLNVAQWVERALGVNSGD